MKVRSTNFSLSQALPCFLLGTILAAYAQDPPAYTELISPNAQSGGGFGWAFGGLPDLTRDGVAEFYVLGENNRCYVYDGVRVELLYTILATTNPNSCGFISGAQSAGDLDGDGIPELMLGGACSTNFYRVQFFNGATGAHLFNLNAPAAITSGFFGNIVRLLPDMTGDGKEDWLIHQPEHQSRAGRVYIFDSQTRAVVRTIQNAEAAYIFQLQYVEAIPDVNQDGKPELLIGCWNTDVTRNDQTISNAGRAIVRSLQSGEVVYELQEPEPTAEGGFGVALQGVGDITGDGIGDIAVGTHRKDDQTGVIYFFSGATGEWLRTLRAPKPQPNGKFGWRMESLPDLNADGVPELWTQEDGFNQTYVYDGATSAVLKTIEYPGPLGPLFFIGTVRQTAAPGLRAWLFGSEFVNNSEGRVYYMPFTPISVPPPPGVQSLGLTASGFRLRVTGRPGSTVEIQGSVDLRTWETLAAPTLADQPVDFEESAAAQLPRRFYRARERQ